MRALNVSRATLARMLHMKGDDRKTIDWSDMWTLADALGIPRSWFTADLARLGEIVPDGLPAFPTEPERPADVAEGADRQRGAPQPPSATSRPGRSRKAREA